jgi:hypothetical protein
VNFRISANTNCSAFTPGSYVIWSGAPHCPGWQNELNITTPNNIPQYIIRTEDPNMVYIPTNIYYVS